MGPQMMKHEDYARHDAVGLATLLRRREVSPSEVVEAAFARIEHVNSRINAVVHLFSERARELTASDPPDGPFKGVPFLIKDLAGALEGAPLTKGSKALRHHIARHDSEMVARYRRSGVVFI